MRHEIKYLISAPSAKIVKSLLSPVLDYDPHYTESWYTVSSLYFDDLSFSAYNEKVDGMPEREKFRIRIYNSDTSYIVLEKKSKKNDLVSKDSIRLTKDLVSGIISGEKIRMEDSLAREFDAKLLSDGLRPLVTVKYDRTAFVYRAENTRITIDENIRFSLSPSSLSDINAVFIPLQSEFRTVMEVKYDRVFPSFLVPVLSSVPTERTSYSKYAMAVSAIEGSYL